VGKVLLSLDVSGDERDSAVEKKKREWISRGFCFFLLTRNVPKRTLLSTPGSNNPPNMLNRPSGLERVTLPGGSGNGEVRKGRKVAREGPDQKAR
jgi:hypothetical protein